MDQTVNNGFISVAIQYRLGAFGFLSSAALVEHGGLPNAALHDMRFALQWVEKYISRFGGDPDQVTIGGESAGGGSVMLLAMANGGEEKTSLFRRAISSSPYLPTQPNFDDPLPTEYYQEFARRAGCLSPDSDSAFKCLQNADTLVLQNASAYTSYGAKYGQWSFIPVTDGKLIRKRPTEQLREGKVNGEAILTGNNANEGNNFVPQNITTESHFISFLKLNYPLLSPANLAAVMKLYSIDTDTTAPSTRFDTDGLHPPYATSMSAFASGWQQAANNLYAETTFVCSANWLADAFTVTGNTLKYGDPLRPNRTAWRYQFSIPNAFHGQDVAPLLADPTVPDARIQSEEFRRGFQSIWGRFIVAGDPTLPGELTGASDSGDGGNWFDGSWWNARGWHEMLNINVTEGTTPQGVNWAVVDGNEWEGWRRERCGLWAELGEVIRQ
ncbi:Alpha/Beta hydrolase protein [Bombardia bombarda]|uniref:Carboxylic ester hydrolase n=1 Tax=Bombardia bombarda TaxID=252184 RepID=A0AA39X0T4_9PEZI|nr:Alpha/Beta hydrolase protein [Bombardia bombarda]